MSEQTSQPYQVLARRYRPSNFSEVAGQSSATDTLSQALKMQRLHHAYLFTGTRGVGKTTIARILAKCFNCETGITDSPCDRCQNCLDITAGRFVDLIEVDAASRTKVEETRELLENMHYAPSRGRFKVYLIDEVHMLSKHSFNALLKTIEEPPEHVKFLFATTDPQKIPATIISRCLQFHLRRLDHTTLHRQLTHILQQEKISFDEASIALLVRAADGSVRDALSLLDQAISHGQGKLQVERLQQLLGVTGDDQIDHILSAIAQQDCQALLAVCQALASAGGQPQSILDQLLSTLHRITIAQCLAIQKSSQALIEQATDARSLRWSQQFTAQQVQVLYQAALLGKRDIALAPSLYVGFEMTLLRMLAFQQQQPLPMQTQPHATQPQDAAASATRARHSPPLSTTASTGIHNTPRTHENTQRSQAQATTSIVPAHNASHTSPANTQPNVNSVQVAATPATAKPAASSKAQQTHTPPAVHKIEPLSDTNPTLTWNQELIDQLQLSGAARALAQQCSWQSYQDSQITLAVHASHKALAQANYIKRIETAICQLLGQKLLLRVEIGDKAVNSPHNKQKLEHQQKKNQQLKKAHNSPFINSLVSNFDASIMEESLQTNE